MSRGWREYVLQRTGASGWAEGGVGRRSRKDMVCLSYKKQKAAVAALVVLPGRNLGRLAQTTEFLAELLDATGSIDDLLLARVERMAVRAHFNVQRFVHGRLGRELLTAGAGDFDFFVFGMDTRLHWKFLRELRADPAVVAGSR